MKLNFKRRISPVFIVLLLLSVLMWYMTKLSHIYTAEAPINVRIGDNCFSVQCAIKSQGYKILAYRMFRKNEILLKENEVDLSIEDSVSNRYSISPQSLQNAMMIHNPSIVRIVSIDDIPDIVK